MIPARRDSISIPAPVLTPTRLVSPSDPRIVHVLALRAAYFKSMDLNDRDKYRQAHSVLSREEKRVFVEIVEAEDRHTLGGGR